MSVLETLNAASPATRDVPLIVDKALHAKWHDLQAQLAPAASQDDPTASLASAGKVIDEMETIRGQVEASEVTFRFAQLDSWTDYIELQAEHAPRKDKVVDRLNGYNVETFPPALIRASCFAVVGHDGDTQEREDPADEDWLPAETWANLFASFNSRQLNELFSAAREVNDRSPAVPPSARSLLASQDSGASLAQPGPGTSPPSGSEGGSRRTSRKSSATKKAASSGT